MIKIYGIKDNLIHVREKLSETINRYMVEALTFPENKQAHRFFPMERENFYAPEGRTKAYTIIEIAMMEGRSSETRKRLIQLLFTRIEADVGIAPIDVEITITETPATNWGFRGVTGDTAVLDYKITV